jgi:hypothetical protein
MTDIDRRRQRVDAQVAYEEARENLAGRIFQLQEIGKRAGRIPSIIGAVPKTRLTRYTRKPRCSHYHQMNIKALTALSCANLRIPLSWHVRKSNRQRLWPARWDAMFDG